MALQTALLLAPTAIRTLSNVFGKGKPSKQEKRLFRMADIFGSEASVPITENRAFKSGMSVLDNRDRKNRKAIANQSAATGATDEATLANTQNANETMNMGIQRLLDYAERARSRNSSLELQTLGRAENTRNRRIANRQRNLNSILGPVSDTVSAFTMASVFGKEPGWEFPTPAKTVKPPSLPKVPLNRNSIWR